MSKFFKALWELEFIRDLFTVVWLLDTVFTAMFVSKGGVELEANPIMREAIIQFGIVGFVLIKFAILEFMLTFFIVNKTWVKIAAWLLSLMTFYVAVLGAMTLKVMHFGL